MYHDREFVVTDDLPGHHAGIHVRLEHGGAIEETDTEPTDFERDFRGRLFDMRLTDREDLLSDCAFNVICDP